MRVQVHTSDSKDFITSSISSSQSKNQAMIKHHR